MGTRDRSPADLEKISSILRDLPTGVYLPPRLDHNQGVRLFLTQIHERSGIDFSTYKTPTSVRRLQRRIVATGTENLDSYVDYVSTHPDEYRKLISSFLIKVTEFFRNPELFDYLRERVLPELIAAARRRGNELRLWSAGCATGEEPYSLAILVAEALGDELERFTVRIFATDLDGDAITFARRGVYPAATLAPLSAGLTARYFTPVDDAYEVKKRIRALTVFGQHDLGQRAPFPRIDLCLCRNVLIYFTPELQKRALQILAFSLRDGSYLALGKAESTSPLTESFAPVNSTLKIYRRGTGSALGQEGLVLVPTTRNDVLPLMPSRPRAAGRRAPAQPTPDQRRIPTSHDTLGAYLLNTPLGLVVVDRRYDIQAINVAARRQLNIHGPAIGDDLIHLTTILPADAMRAAIDGALRDGTPTSLDEVATTDVETGDATYLRVACYPQRDDEKSPVDVVMILVSDVSAAVRERRALEEGLARQRQDEEQATARMAELVERNRALLQANEELARANMDLRGCSHASTRSRATTTIPVPGWVWACLSHRN